MPVDYTLVVGVDRKHLDQLAMTWPTWYRHKPSLLKHPMIVFYDAAQLKEVEVRTRIRHPNIHCYPWPLGDTTYGGNNADKFSDPQRYKMLAGFVYVPSIYVRTKYWLKIDTDTVATGLDDWIDVEWFKDNPAIVSQRWTFTKPPDQMLKLDKWVEDNKETLTKLYEKEPLNLIPEPGSDRLGHRRIISWCSFFDTSFTKQCALAAKLTCSDFHLPVPSQDGFVWYIAKRLGLGIRTVNMKDRGWEHWSTERNIMKAVMKVL